MLSIKKNVGALIIGITALIAIIGAVAASTTTLIQKIHTAQHVDQLTKNITYALVSQKNINKKLKTKKLNL